MSTTPLTKTNTKNNIECYIYGAPVLLRFIIVCLRTIARESFTNIEDEIPQGLEKNNKENICIATTSPPQVFEAYSNQFERDFTTFLKLRGEELRGGGRMVLGFIGRSVADPTSKDELKTITLLSETLSDMVAEGLVKEEDLHSFNIPIYAPSIQEIKTAIESEGSFNLDKMEVVLVPLDANEDYNNYDNMVSDKNNTSAEPMLVAHFGSSINVDVIFDVYAEKTAKHLSVERSSYFTPVISLTRKTMTD
ncbi:hypothetical protein ABFS83_02G133200 [Erythranthe nasuta]